jgi:hypothetical protein
MPGEGIDLNAEGGPSRKADTDRNLLFGMLAVQMNLVTRDALIAGMNA